MKRALLASLLLLAGCAKNPVNIATRDAVAPEAQTASALSSVSISPNSFSAAGKATITLTMTSRSGGIRYVALKSSSTAVKVPSSCGVWTNDSQDVCNTQAVISAVTSPQTVIITATYNGVSKTALVTLNGGSALTYTMTAAPASVAFGNVTVGQSATQTIKLTNTGTGTIDVTGIALTGAGVFDMTPQASIGTIAPGTSQSFTVTFSPTLAGAEAGSISITSNATPITIPLTGTGISISPPPTITPKTVSCSPAAITGPGTCAGLVTLTSAPASATAVPVTSSSPSVTVSQPSSVAAGATTGTFTASALAVTGAVTATITASLNGGTASTTVTDNPPAPPLTAYTVTLKWAAPTTTAVAVTGYHVYRAASNGSYSLLSAPSGLTYADSLPASADGLTYSYLVRSYDAAGVESASSNVLSETIP